MGTRILRGEIMSKIKNLIAKETTSWIPFPDVDGFEVHLRFLAREDLLKIRNQSLTFKFNKRTRQREEEIDNDRFLEAYAGKAIMGWRGLKIKHLPMLLPVDISGADTNEEVDYSEEEAIDLLKSSSIFDQFITDAMNDFEQFSKKKADEAAKN
jgi:hypothetical protein